MSGAIGSVFGVLPYSWNSVLLDVVQSSLVALPAAGLPPLIRRLAGGRAWSLIMPVSIVAVVVGLALLPGAAIALTWLALLAVPVLAAATLGWGMHGARPGWAIAALPLLAAAIAYEGETVGDLAALLLTALSCVALARLLCGVVAGDRAARGQTWVRVALVAMAVLDAILVFSSALQGPNATLNAAVPAAELPRLQFVTFGGASMGYGDVFVAAVLGAVLAAEGASRRVQLAAAGAVFVASLLFSLLWWVDSISTLPATVPVAVVLLIFGGLRGWPAGWSAVRRRSPEPPSPVS